jgi:NAD(P)-dependent dehydrogenase (short-subunit alcohol dehydrogenase family)
LRIFGWRPNLVIAAALTFPKDVNDPLEIPPQDLERDTAVNLFGAYTAMREAVRGFKTLSDGNLPNVFIATGNVVPWQPSPFGITLGTGKAALVNLIAASVKAYSAKKYRYVAALVVALR